jgi:hypothetical protein
MEIYVSKRTNKGIYFSHAKYSGYCKKSTFVIGIGDLYKIVPFLRRVNTHGKLNTIFQGLKAHLTTTISNAICIFTFPNQCNTVQ